MELYGSLSNISGSVSASVFTGSYIGDGAGLYNLPASGVVGLNLSQIATGSVSASLSPDGFNVNTDTSITGSVNITGSISLNGEPIGTGKLDETTFQAYTSSNDERVTALEISSGSLNSFTSSIDTTIKSKLDNDGVISGSIQVDITGTTGYSTFSSSISSSIGDISSSIATTTNNLSTSIASTDLSQTNRLISIESKTGSYATTGSNLFIGTQTHSGSILPSVDNEYDLGSPTYQWRDVYISSGSLYIDGTKVISSTAQELTITTDTGQSIKILEGTTDSIILQTADGDIELKSSADGDILLDPTNGKIMLKGTIEVFNGNKIQSSVGGTPVVFANDIVVSGSIELTGTVDGIDLTNFSSSVNTRVSDLESGAGSLNAFTASASGRLNSLETESGSIRTNFNSYTSSTDSKLNSIETTTGSIITTNTEQGGRLDSIESKTGSYATTGSNNFFGSQYITGSLTISDNLTVLGSSSIVYSTASQLIVEDNVIVVNSSFPAERFAGLEVHDSGSNGSVTASLFWDGLNNRWIYQNTSEAHYGGGMFIAGPRNTGSLGDEPGLTNGTIPKSIGGDHIGDSIINEFSGSIAINGALIITGSILSTVAPLVSGSSQISFNGITDKPTLVSGSGQISFNGITDKPTLVSGSSQISFNNISDKPTLVSGSSQISFNSITDKPTLVSGSAQIDLTATTNYSSGIKTRLNAENVISGSAQVVAALPAGTVSGSAQITLSSTTGYGSVLNQAVLTSSTPTFAGVTSTAQISAGYSNASEPFVNGHFYNTSGTAGTQYGGVLLSGVQQAHLRFLVGTNTWGGSGAKQWQIRVGNGVGEDNMKIYSWTYGADVLTISSNAAAVFAGNISAANLSGTNTGDQTLNSLGALSNDSDSEQDVGGRYFRFNHGANRINIDPRWNESGYDADLGVFHMYSTTAAGVQWGRTGLALYNGSEYQYLTTKGSTTGLFANDSLILTAGNYTSYAMAGAGYSANQNLNTNSNVTFNSVTGAITSSGSGDSNAPFRFAADYSGWMSLAAGSPGSNNGWGLFWAGNSGAQYGTNGAGGPGDIWSNSGNPNEFVFVGNGSTNMSIHGNTGNVWVAGDFRNNGSMGVGVSPAVKFHVRGSNEFVRFENTSTGSNQYVQLNMRAGSRNGYIWIGNENTSSWAGDGGLNIYTDFGNLDFWTNATQKTRITRNGTLLNGHVGVSPTEAAWLGAGVFGVSGYNKVMIGSLNSTTTGAYVVGHNSALNAWADLNIAGEALIFRYQQTERARFDTSGNFIPGTNNAYNLGSASLGWANVYTNDLHLSNMNKPEGNDVDGTNGNWTIQEGAENLYIINNNNGKKFKISLEEII